MIVFSVPALMSSNKFYAVDFTFPALVLFDVAVFNAVQYGSTIPVTSSKAAYAVSSAAPSSVAADSRASILPSQAALASAASPWATKAALVLMSSHGVGSTSLICPAMAPRSPAITTCLFMIGERGE